MPLPGDPPQVGNIPLPKPPATPTPPAEPEKASSHWDQDAMALWKSIGDSFNTGLQAQFSDIDAQTSLNARRANEANAVSGGAAMGGAAMAGQAQAQLGGIQQRQTAIAGNEKNKLGAKMAMLQMYMDRAKADDNLEAQKQIQAMMDETNIMLALAQGGGIDYTQVQNILKD